MNWELDFIYLRLTDPIYAKNAPNLTRVFGEQKPVWGQPLVINVWKLSLYSSKYFKAPLITSPPMECPMKERLKFWS